MSKKMKFCLFFREDREIPAASGDPGNQLPVQTPTGAWPKLPIKFRIDGQKYTTPLISLDCFIYLELLSKLCFFTNLYFENTSHLKPSYGTSWTPIIVTELSNYIAL